MAELVKIRPKQRELAHALLENERKPPNEKKTATDIMLSVGYTRANVDRSVNRIFSTEGLQAALLELGVTPPKLLNTGVEAMTANKGSFYRGEYKETDNADHQTRLQGAHFLADVLGLKKQVIENRNVNVNVEMDDIAGMID